MVTNAIRASAHVTGDEPGQPSTTEPPPVRLWLSSDKHQILIHVMDGDPRMPAPRAAGLDAEDGRGLLLVESLSAAWGAIPAEGMDGKLVWAHVT